jgi:uncharacterized protein (TIGR00369 family)
MTPTNEQATSPETLEALGWKARALPGFIGTAGPLWTRKENDTWRYGILCGRDHLNPAGVAHGGLLATLMDHAVSTVAWESCGRSACVTLQLDMHYLAPVREGQFVQVQAHLVHRAGSLVFMRAQACVDGMPVASAQAALKTRGARGEDSRG